MKKLIFSSLMMLVAAITSSFAQRPATACGAGCSTVTVSARNDSACGGDFDNTFTISNNSYQMLDIAMFVEKRSGEWKDLGLVTSVSSRRVLEDAFWSCDLSGRFMIYYRVTDTSDKFPSQAEVNRRMNYGY